MNEPERKTKISLEDLIQFKRAERPPAEFWAEFEQAMRTKQLAAIVETRPWWRNLATSRVLVRWCVPLGATAVVAMTFGSFRGFIAQQGPVVPVNNVAAIVESNVESTSSDFSNTTEQVAVATILVADTTSDSDLVRAGGSAQVAIDVSDNPTVQQPAVDAGASELVLAQLNDNLNATSVPTVAARAPAIEPLAQVITPRDSRRARLLAYSVTFDPHAADSSDAVRSRERITRRISDEAIYDSITRLGLSGDRFSIKF
ncbi:MAG: hypothetical protein IPP19_06020 [Verrucomicrobia bacterium]|nr:hypothetical protein [Verrucomicrobiota bacterium]